MSSDVTRLSESVDLNQETINNPISKVTYDSEAQKFVMLDNKTHDEHIPSTEPYNSKNNLFFRGYIVKRDDTESPEVKVRNILRYMQITEMIPFIRCHYLKGDRQIIVQFQWYSDREKIWENRYRLNGTNYHIEEDFPVVEEQQRKQPSPVTKAAKELPERNKKVTMRGDKVLLNGKVFTCSDIERGPKSTQPAKLDERSNKDVLVFGGPTNAHYGLSNFYEERFVYEHIAYNTAEQAYQHKKARIAGDQNMQKKIMFHPNAATQRHFGEQIQVSDEAKWNEERRGHMKDILLAKFSQLANLQKLLIDTGDKRLAEANAKDNYFGIGLPLTHKDVLNPKKWPKHGNQLGAILIEIRQELSS